MKDLIKVGYLVELVGPIRNNGLFIAMLDRDDDIVLCNESERYSLDIFNKEGISSIYGKGIEAIYGRGPNAYLLNITNTSSRELIWKRIDPYSLLKPGYLVLLKNSSSERYFLAMLNNRDELSLCNDTIHFTIDFLKRKKDYSIEMIYDRPSNTGMLNLHPTGRDILYRKR